MTKEKMNFRKNQAFIETDMLGMMAMNLYLILLFA